MSIYIAQPLPDTQAIATEAFCTDIFQSHWQTWIGRHLMKEKAD